MVKECFLKIDIKYRGYYYVIYICIFECKLYLCIFCFVRGLLNYRDGVLKGIWCKCNFNE